MVQVHVGNVFARNASADRLGEGEETRIRSISFPPL